MGIHGSGAGLAHRLLPRDLEPESLLLAVLAVILRQEPALTCGS